jgi:hypothetical protein
MELLELSMWFGVSLVFIVLLILGVRQIWKFFFCPKKQEKVETPVKRKTVEYYLIIAVNSDDTATIVAKDPYESPYPERSQKWFHEDGLKLVGYGKLKSSPVEAVRETTTTLQGVEVEVPQSPVDEGLDVVFPDTPASKQIKLEDIKAGIKPKGVADAETSKSD